MEGGNCKDRLQVLHSVPNQRNVKRKEDYYEVGKRDGRFRIRRRRRRRWWWCNSDEMGNKGRKLVGVILILFWALFLTMLD